MPSAAAYRRLVLTQRPTARPMPSVEIVDLRTHMPDGEAFLSAPLRTAIGETLAAGDQAILFLNRRGFATFVLCRGVRPRVSLPALLGVADVSPPQRSARAATTAGSRSASRTTCPSCGGKDTIVRKGLGTEKVADAVAAEFPTARVARLDRDVASGAKIEAVLVAGRAARGRHPRRHADGDQGPRLPGRHAGRRAVRGYRARTFRTSAPSERTFQLLAQVAGRAGRGDRPGRVIVQTYRPSAPAVIVRGGARLRELLRRRVGGARRARVSAARPADRGAASTGRTQTRSRRRRNGSPSSPRRSRSGRDRGLVEVRGAVPAPIERLRSRTRWQIWLRGSRSRGAAAGRARRCLPSRCRARSASASTSTRFRRSKTAQILPHSGGDPSESARLFMEAEDRWYIASPLSGLAAIAVSIGKPEVARLLGAAAGLRETSGFTILASEQERDEQTVTGGADAGLGEEAYALGIAAGRRLTIAQAVEEAVAVADCLVGASSENAS